VIRFTSISWRLSESRLQRSGALSSFEPAIQLSLEAIQLSLDAAWTTGIVRLDAADGQIQRISDYQQWPWTLSAGSIVVREFVA
jgi:hypothetical protein